MKINEVYKIADSKDSYTIPEIKEAIERVGQRLKLPRFTSAVAKRSVGSKRYMPILFPIYNEGALLAETIPTHLNSYFDPAFSYSFFYYLNNCTDNSRDIAVKALSKHIKLQEQRFSQMEMRIINDRGVNARYIVGELNGNKFYVIETNTKGKFNALKSIGALTRSNGAEAIISFDTDIFLEPQTILKLSYYGYQRVLDGKDTVAASGHTIMVNKHRRGKIENWFRSHGVWNDQKYLSLSGCNMVLNIKWMLSNIVDVATEDYALGLKARYQRYQLEKVDGAHTWAYRTNTVDDLKQLARSIRGRFQLMETSPELIPTIQKDHFFMRPFKERVIIVKGEIEKQPRNVMKLVWKLMFVELSRIRAKKLYSKDPRRSDWEQLTSSR